MNTKNAACIYIAFLRGLYLLYQNFHWQAKGNNFYSQHLLFERLYKKSQENADLAAEKFIGLFDNSAVMLDEQIVCISTILNKYKISENCNYNTDLVKLAIQAEQDFLKFSEKIYDLMETNGKLSMGLDDMLLSISSDREESIYLLKQTL